MNRALAILVAVTWPLITAGSCATTREPPPVQVPIAVSCIPDELGPLPAGLETRESLARAPSDEELMKRLYADWKVRVARMLETEPVLAACR
jgi:hypothetical protein